MHLHQVTSLFEQCVLKIDDGLRTPLIEQRRMPSQIAELVKGPVYGGNYITPDVPASEAAVPLASPSFPTPVMFLDTSAQPNPWDDTEGTSCINRLEADWAIAVCRAWHRELVRRNAPRITVSVLAFYGAQAKLIRRRLGYPRYPGLDRLQFKVVDAVDRIQGQESDLVIVSFCRTFGRRLKDGRRVPTDRAPSPEFARWLQNINRLNVASTRAKRSLILIGHRPTLQRLNGVPPAEAFYSNLFDLLDRGEATLRTDVATPIARRR
jgi:superfamily I DNA and/or RNA helicase